MFGLERFPCSDYQLALLATHLSKFMVYSSVSNYMQGVIFAHKLVGLNPPSVSSPPLKLTLQGISRTRPGGARVRDPITVRHLAKMYKCLNVKIASNHMFWACCLLLFRTLQRVSHVIAFPHTLKGEDVRFAKTGTIICVHTSKSNQFKGVPHVIPVACVKNKSLCSVCWLRSWVKRSKPRLGDPLFSLHNHEPLSYSSFQSGLKKLVSLAGIKQKISSHSFRKGGATFLSSIRVPIEKIKERGNWTSDAIFKYVCEPLHVKVANELKVAACFDVCS